MRASPRVVPRQLRKTRGGTPVQARIPQGRTRGATVVQRRGLHTTLHAMRSCQAPTRGAMVQGERGSGKGGDGDGGGGERDRDPGFCAPQTAQMFAFLA